MTQYKLNVDADAVQGLFTRDDALAGLVEQIVQQVLEAQVTDYLQAQPYERTTERQGYRNGYKPRRLTTRVGTLELRVPQVRQGEFSTDLFLRFQRSEQAFGAGPDGDGGAGGLHPQGDQDHRGAVWSRGVQEHGLRVVWAAGPPGDGLERAAAGGDRVSLWTCSHDRCHFWEAVGPHAHLHMLWCLRLAHHNI